MLTQEPNIKAILFDLDGTLLDSLQDLAESANLALEQNSFPPHPIQSYNTFVGDGVYSLMERATPQGTPNDSIQNCVVAMKAIYQENWKKHSKLYNGISEVLTYLTKQKISINILSNKPESFCQEIMEYFFSDWAFDTVRGARENCPLKPDPTSALKIIQSSPFSASEWLYVGDTDTDMKTAKGANLKAVGVTWGFRSEKELLDSGADIILHQAKDFLKIV